MNQSSDVEKTDSKETLSCLKRTKRDGRRKVCVLFKTVTDKLTIFANPYGNNLYLNDIEIDLELTDYQSLLAK